ncbi:MAG: hypothetical protein JRI46_00075 [Deltaproteobacteria bacterium]|nr:hypothetical protein [Deltaproteobacteria bacterium]
MSKVTYVILIAVMCCVSVGFAQQQYKKVYTPQAKEVQRLERVIDLSQKQMNDLRKKVANLEERIRKLEQHIAIGSGGNITITATNLNIRASGRTEIRSGATMDIRSSLLKLNGGGTPVARLGDITSGASTGGFSVNTRIIGVGSSTVLVP